ncbi:MAG: phage tail assembly chaperone [Acetivibrio ethanolgignens]
MSNFEAFLNQNKKKQKNVKVVASKDFVDESGNPVEWEIRALKPNEAEKIRSVCNTVRGDGVVITDNAQFNRMVAAKCTVYPNLNDKELQDSYGVMGAEELIQEMLDKDGEYQAYVGKILELSGYKTKMSDLVKEAKN